MGLTSMLRKGDLWSKPSAAVASVFFWLLIVVALLTGMSALHIRVVDGMIAEVLLYLPRIVSAILILIVGYIATGFIARGLLISLVNSGFHFSKQFARAARLLLIMLIIAMALEQLQVAPGVVVAAFSIVFGGIVLALAISFGECRDRSGQKDAGTAGGQKQRAGQGHSARLRGVTSHVRFLPDRHHNDPAQSGQTRRLDRLEAELQEYSRARPIALVLPALYSEFEGPAMPRIVEELGQGTIT